MINYAWQFHERQRGRFYVELPFLVVGGSSGTVGREVVGRAGGSLFVIPGLRYQHNLTDRFALSVAAGVGAAIGHQKVGIVTPQVVRGYEDTSATVAADLGGGVDFRLTRLLSLRAEVRDFVSGRTGGLARRNNVAYQFGFALHF